MTNTCGVNIVLIIGVWFTADKIQISNETNQALEMLGEFQTSLRGDVFIKVKQLSPLTFNVTKDI